MGDTRKSQMVINEDCSKDCSTKSKIFLEILSKISCKLININLGKEYLVEECLQEIGQKTGSSRAYIFLFRNDLDYMDNVYEWCANGVSAEKDNLQNLKTEDYQWWMKKLKTNEFIVIEDVEQMPQEAKLEKETLLYQGIKSLIVIPIIYEEHSIGYMGLDNVFKNKNWDENSRFSLGLISEIFSGAFKKLEYEKEFKYVN